MTGEELKEYIKDRGLSMARVAEELETSPQNLNGKLKAKSLKSDFLQKVKSIIDKCAPPLPAEMENAVMGTSSQVISGTNIHHNENISGDAALWKKLYEDKAQELDKANKRIDQLLAIIERTKI